MVWGVHIPGREWLLLELVRRREAPDPPSLPFDSWLVGLSLLDLSVSAFSDIRPGILQCHSVSKSDRLSSIKLRISAASCAECVCVCANTEARFADILHKRELDWTWEDNFLKWVLVRLAEHFILEGKSADSTQLSIYTPFTLENLRDFFHVLSVKM